MHQSNTQNGLYLSLKRHWGLWPPAALHKNDPNTNSPSVHQSLIRPFFIWEKVTDWQTYQHRPDLRNQNCIGNQVVVSCGVISNTVFERSIDLEKNKVSCSAWKGNTSHRILKIFLVIKLGLWHHITNSKFKCHLTLAYESIELMCFV